MTKEQFGLRLFETIYVVGRLLTIRSQRAVAVHTHDHLRLAELDTVHGLYQQELAHHITQLTAEEVAQVVTRYPWVAHV